MRIRQIPSLGNCLFGNFQGVIDWENGDSMILSDDSGLVYDIALIIGYVYPINSLDEQSGLDWNIELSIT